MKTLLAVSTSFFLLAACGADRNDARSEGEPTPDPAPAAETRASIYEAALSSDKRPEADRTSDAGRKPEAVLEFFGVEPGDVVLEMWAGSGYYTELLSSVVGANGKVYAHVNTPMINFAGEAFPKRHADGRLANTEVLIGENNELSLEADRFDIATIILNYHDVYWSSDQYGWDTIDVPVFTAELYKSVKPGGVLGIVDHRAAPGSPAETGNSLHRIDPDIVIADLEAAGFVLDARSDILANPDDDLAMNVFDPSVRGKTDRFVLRFVKPE